MAKVTKNPFHLVAPGATPQVITTDDKHFYINFIVMCDGEETMGTLEYFGTKSGAKQVASELISTGVYCKVRPDKRWLTPETCEWVTPFRLVEKPEELTQVSQERLAAALAKRQRRVAKQRG
jgi:hypothetical protein